MLFHNRTAVKLISQISCAREMTLPQSSLEVHALSLKTLHNNVTNFVRRNKETSN